MSRSFLLIPLALFAIPARAADGPVEFSRDVLPILSDNCFFCHGPDEKARKAKLRFDTKEGAFRKRDGESVISPGKAAESEMI
jgi:Planctomycete cytochrome C